MTYHIFKIRIINIKVIPDPCLKITECVFIKVSHLELSLFIVLKHTSTCIGVHKKILIIYQHICMTVYFLYFDRRVQFHPSIRSESVYLVRQFWSKTLIFIRIQCLLRHPRFIKVR